MALTKLVLMLDSDQVMALNDYLEALKCVHPDATEFDARERFLPEALAIGMTVQATVLRPPVAEEALRA